jgi:excisionase family DNA binding protein
MFTTKLLEISPFHGVQAPSGALPVVALPEPRLRREFWRGSAPVNVQDPGNSMPSVVLTVDEACDVLRVSRWTLYRLIRSRQLLTIKIGRRRYVPRKAVYEMVERLSDEGLL